MEVFNPIAFGGEAMKPGCALTLLVVFFAVMGCPRLKLELAPAGFFPRPSPVEKDMPPADFFGKLNIPIPKRDDDNQEKRIERR